MSAGPGGGHAGGSGLAAGAGLLALACTVGLARLVLERGWAFRVLGAAPGGDAAGPGPATGPVAPALACAGAGLGLVALLALRSRRSAPGANPGRAAAARGALAAWTGLWALGGSAPFAVDALLGAWLAPLGAAGERVVLALTWLAVAAGGWRFLRRPVGTGRARPARRRPVAARPALAVAVLGACLLAGEGLLRVAGLGARAWARPLLVVPGDERRVPLSEIALFRPFGDAAANGGLSARFRPCLYLKGWYDRPRWDYFDEGGHVDYVFDNHGLRDDDFELDKPAGRLRVLAIGDSFTFGVGVQHEDCWTEVLERGLRERRGDAEVINAGFAAGYHPGSYEDWIATSGLRLEPDVVIVGLCLNDLHTGISLYAYPTRPRREQPWGGRSALLNALDSARAPAVPGLDVPRDWDALLAADPALWEANRMALRRTHALLAARGIRFLVVPFPMMSGLREEAYPYAGLMRRVLDFCAQEGIETVDLLPAFRGRVDADLWVHVTDQHPNDVGQRLLGAGLLELVAPR